MGAEEEAQAMSGVGSIQIFRTEANSLPLGKSKYGASSSYPKTAEMKLRRRLLVGKKTLRMDLSTKALWQRDDEEKEVEETAGELVNDPGRPESSNKQSEDISDLAGALKELTMGEGTAKQVISNID